MREYFVNFVLDEVENGWIVGTKEFFLTHSYSLFGSFLGKPGVQIQMYTIGNNYGKNCKIGIAVQLPEDAGVLGLVNTLGIMMIAIDNKCTEIPKHMRTEGGPRFGPGYVPIIGGGISGEIIETEFSET